MLAWHDIIFSIWRAKRASNRRFEGVAREGQRRCPRGAEALPERGRGADRKGRKTNEMSVLWPRKYQGDRFKTSG